MSGHRISVSDIATGRFWPVAVLTTAGAVGLATGLATPAEASRYYWSNYEPGYYQSRPAPVQPRQQRARPRKAKKVIETPKDSVKPTGPLIIAISIDRQTMKVYDANGFFAESPISTGTKGHPTPTGVFSVIQKRKLHHSNIYSGAPMPFMQRITWSGIAMHAGALPGYPASHGCIRMPMAFAARMWNWTKMGARVVITPGEITPARFAHPLLAEQKVAPQPPTATLEPDPDAPPAAKGDKAADAGATVTPANSETGLELRSTVGHDGGVARPLRDQTRTADASGAIPTANAPVTMSDASSSAANTARSALHEAAVATAGSLPLIAADAASAGIGDAPKAETKSEAASAEAESAAAKPDQIASPDQQPAEAKPSEAASAVIEPAATEAADSTGKKPDGTADNAQASGDAVKAEATESAKPQDSITAATDPRPDAPEAKKDQTRLPDTEKAVVAKPEPPKPAGRIAVLVSGKDGKLYVRENFKPLFEVPVTIAPSDRLLGTHVFTAQVDKDDANLLRWTAVSLPVKARNPQKNGDDDRSSRRRKIAGIVPAEAKPPLPAPNSPAEALDRITIPPEAKARIAEALSTGGSIVVSDHGINQSGETGEGTDFIVPLR